MQKFYVDSNGAFIGAFDGVIPENGIEVQTAPNHVLDTWDGDSWVMYVAPQTKEQLLERITVTTQSGKIFDGDELSQTRIARALQIGEFTGQTSTAWKLADNTVQQVTYVELQEALTLAMIEVGRIVGAIE